METVVAKEISGRDVHHMYQSIELTEGLCPICKNVIRKVPNLNYRLSSKHNDLYYTYDGFAIVSNKFKIFCEEFGYDYLYFTELSHAKGFYFFESGLILNLDPVKSKLRFFNKRDCCGSFDETIISSYILSLCETSINDSFIGMIQYYLGSYSSKARSIIIGKETAKMMKEYGLRGIDYDNAYKLIKMEKKPIDEITLDDMKRYPIWVFDYENESDEEEDETWQKPVTNSTDVTKDMYEAYIYLRSDDAVYDLSGCIDVDKLTLTDLCFWDSISKVWVPVEQINNYQVLKLVAVPSVLSQSDMKFEYDENSDSFISAVKSDRPSLWDKIKRGFN